MKKKTLEKFGFIPSRFVSGGYLLIFIGFIFLYFEFSKLQIKTTNDLFYIKGHFLDYNFIDGMRGTRNYTFRIKEQSNPFKIKADFLGSIFKKSEFEKLNFGDSLIISISKSDVKNLNTNNSYFFVYSISSMGTTILDSNLTIAKHNNNFHYYAFIFFILCGLWSIRFGKKVNKSVDLKLN